MKWTCKGNVRDDCGIIHRSYEVARKCCEKDQRRVKSGNPGGAYSDRYPKPLDDEAQKKERSFFDLE